MCEKFIRQLLFGNQFIQALLSGPKVTTCLVDGGTGGPK